MKLAQIIIFLVLLSFTISLYAWQRPLQETTNAIVDTRISQLERDVGANTQNITLLAKEISALRSSLDQFTGIGVGIGCTLTVLQGLLVVITYKKRG